MSNNRESDEGSKVDLELQKPKKQGDLARRLVALALATIGGLAAYSQRGENPVFATPEPAIPPTRSALVEDFETAEPTVPTLKVELSLQPQAPASEYAARASAVPPVETPPAPRSSEAPPVIQAPYAQDDPTN